MANINARDVSQRALRNSDGFHKQTDHRYVNFSDGNDSNNGSMYRPWKTLSNALLNVTATHDILFSGNEVGTAFSIAVPANISIKGERGATYAGNTFFNNAIGLTLDLDIIGDVVLNNCSNVKIKQGSSINSITANNHSGFLDVSNNVDCDIIFDGAGTNTELFIHENKGGVGAVTFQNGATGEIKVRSSECDFINILGTAGAVTVRLENAYTPSGFITPVAGSATIEPWIDSTIDNTNTGGTNNARTATVEAIVDYVATQTATSPEVITHICASGMNAAMVLTNKALYTASGNNAVFNPYTGRGNQIEPRYFGTTVMQPVPFIGKESGTVVQCHTNYCAQLVLFSDGELWGWGRNNNGQLGLGDVIERPLPVLLRTGVAEILTNETASGYSPNDATQFIKDTDGWIWAAGRNAFGQTGLGDGLVKNTWTRLDWIGQNPLYFRATGSTYGFLHVQKADQTLWGCGYNAFGSLGSGDTVSPVTAVDISDSWFGVGNTYPIDHIVGSGGYFDSVAHGEGHTVIVYDDAGTKVTKAAGNNTWGQLANGTTGGNFPTPAVIPTAGDVADICAIGGGPATMAVLRTDGSLWTWGYNGFGQIGNGTTTNQATPFNAINNVAAILRPEFSSNTYSYGSSIFVRDNNGWCWGCGYNAEGQLGIGNLTDTDTFTRMLLAKTVKYIGQLATGGDGRGITTIIATDDNQLYTCGYNAHNGVHMASAADVSSPVRIWYK